MNTLTRVGRRIFANFFMPDRLGIYHSLLQRLLDHEYRILSLAEFSRLLKSGGLRSDLKFVVLRHDVDTDPRTARRLWDIELKSEVRSSYYFRRSTVDIALMRDIEASGCEASYHYEELATLAKARHFTRREQVEAAMPYLRESFRSNLTRLRQATTLPMITVASHGDFMNRKLGIPNQVILQDLQFRRDLNIVLEAYDSSLMQRITTCCSDSMYPQFWDYGNPDEAMQRGDKRLHILIHPRQWHANVWINVRDDALRFYEGFRDWCASHSQRQPSSCNRTNWKAVLFTSSYGRKVDHR